MDTGPGALGSLPGSSFVLSPLLESRECGSWLSFPGLLALSSFLICLPPSNVRSIAGGTLSSSMVLGLKECWLHAD